MRHHPFDYHHLNHHLNNRFRYLNLGRYQGRKNYRLKLHRHLLRIYL